MAGNEYEAIRALVQSSSRMREEMDAMRVSFDSTTNELLRLVDRLTLERDEANRESERLRQEAWERRNDTKPTWVTSEHHEAFVKLREQLASAEAERAHAVAALGEQSDRFRAERDEARREVCELRCNPPERFVGLPHELAEINGWDCYREGA